MLLPICGPLFSRLTSRTKPTQETTQKTAPKTENRERKSLQLLRRERRKLFKLKPGARRSALFGVWRRYFRLFGVLACWRLSGETTDTTDSRTAELQPQPETETEMAVREVDIVCTDAQKNLITAESTPNSLINVVSGPGTGKTTSLCNRIVYLLANGTSPSEILVFSLTNQAVLDFKKTLSKVIGEDLASSINISTIHSLASNIVTYDSPYWETVRDKKSLESRTLHTMLNMLTKRRMKKDHPNHYDRVSPSKTIKARELFEIKVTDPELYKKYLSFEKPGMSSVMKSSNMIFDKMVYEATQILNIDYDNKHLQDTSEYQSQPVNIPPFLENIKEVMLDEFQDISFVLLDFVLALSRNKQLVIAGDINQSLYGFNGATPDFNIKQIIGYYNRDGHSLREFVLDKTFRFSNDIHKMSLNLLGSKYSLIKDAVEEDPLPVIRQEFSTSFQENEFVYNEIQKLIENSKGFLSPKNFAVLATRNTILDDFKNYVANKNSDLKVKRLITSQKWLESKSASLITFLKLLLNPYDDPSFFVALSFYEGIGHITLMRIKNEAAHSGMSILDYLLESDKYEKKISKKSLNRIKELNRSLLKSDPTTILIYLIEISKIFNFSKTLESRAAHEQYYEVLNDFFQTLKILQKINPNDTDLISAFISNYQEGFLKESDIDLLTNNDPHDYVSAVTIHGSKGLEWDIVFVLSNIQVFNEFGSTTVNSRTNYVAATRARHLLYFNKARTEQMLHVDTTKPSDILHNTIKTYYDETVVDYIPKLKQLAIPNDLLELPKFAEPIGINNNDENLGRLLGNITNRKTSLSASTTKLMTNMKRAFRHL